ncbi:MAG: right-handed parallel beta-helix repeat-containing protein [Planctomycetota bacterium]|nr:right-handed parallel beta-helix repeat-containing protein [Planctomycetota bacterium]
MGGTLSGETLKVPQQFKTIQKAMERAGAGDTVLVSAGIYAGTVSLKKGVRLKSAGNDEPGYLGLKRAEATILDLKKAAVPQGVLMKEGSILDGFSVRNFGEFDVRKWENDYETQGNLQEEHQLGRQGRAAILVPGVACTVSNNIVCLNGFSGILIQGKSEQGGPPVIGRNYCFRNMGAGISLVKGSEAKVVENRAFENLVAGIGQNNAHPQLVGNLCYGNVRAGIGISNGSSPLVRENVCFFNRRAGIGVRTGGGTRPLIEGNSCFANAMAGIGSREGARPLILENNCYQNGLAGIGSRDHARPVILRTGAAGIKWLASETRTGWNRSWQVICARKIEPRESVLWRPHPVSLCF